MKKFDYRQHQTIIHRRKNRNYRRNITLLFSSYFAILFLLVGGTYLNTLPHSVSKPTKPVVQAKLNVFPDQSLFQYKAFAQGFVTPTILPTPAISPNWDSFKEEAQAIAKIYNYPVNLLLAQAALESAHGTSDFAINRNNYFGIGAYDWQPNEAYGYENQEQSIIDYIYVIKDNFPEAWQNRSDSSTMLNLLENNDQGTQYASDPQYVYKVTSEPEWSE